MENTTQPTPPASNGRGLGTAGLVVGIIALLFSFIPCLGLWAIVPAIVGIVLSAISMKQAGRVGAPKGMATAGLVCAIVAAAIAIYWIYVTVYLVSNTPDLLREMEEKGVMDSLNKALDQLRDVTDTSNAH